MLQTTWNKTKLALVLVALIAALVGPVAVAHYVEAHRIEAARGARRQGSPAAPLAAADRALNARIKKGELTFNRHCAMCHQLGAQGKLGVAPSLNSREFLALASDSFIRNTVREGRVGTAMAPRRDLSKEEVDDIIVYLRSLSPLRLPDIAVDPTRHYSGDPRKGRADFAVFCRPCHGPEGAGYIAGGTAPGIGLPGFLHLAPDDYIFKTVQYGRTGTPMRPFIGSRGLANLKERDVRDIIAFLKSQNPALEAHYAEEQGEETYNRVCSSCHQAGAVGLVGTAPSLRSPEFLSLATDEFIKKTVRRGRPGTAMAPRPDVTDWELDNIISYLRSLPVLKRPDIAVDPTRHYSGDSREGHRKFTTFCAPCHGPQGEGYIRGGSGPGIGLPGFLKLVPDDYIFKTVQYGRTGTPMHPFIGSRGLANLAEQDIYDIIAFLRSRPML